MRGGFWLGRWRLGRLVGAVAGGVLGASLLVAVPARAATWTPIQDVTAPGWSGSDAPTVAVDREGDSLLVWTACDDALPYCYHQAQARIAPAGGGPLGRILTLSPPGSSSSWPQVAADDNGDSAVVWQQDGVVMGRRVSASGALGTLQTISAPRASTPSVAVEPTGRALVTWTQYGGGTYTAQARYFGADGTLGPVLTLGASSADQTAVAVDRAGGAIVVWAAEGYQGVLARRLRPSAVADPLTIAGPAPEVGYGRVSVTLDRDGDAVISYRRAHSVEPPVVRVRLLSRAGVLGDVIDATPPSHDVTFHSALATDLDGDSVLVWSRRTHGVMADVHARAISRTGALGGITSFGVGDRPVVTLDDDGDGLVAWQAAGPSYAFMGGWASTVSRNGAFGAVEQVSTDGGAIRVDSGPTGRFSVTWQRIPYPYYEIQARFGR
ncbi:MAG TPA: hypothetical protein VES42_20615 [Pilimelia sp.]|nr:hypothetical protein [Pilimelia sp.]